MKSNRRYFLLDELRSLLSLYGLQNWREAFADNAPMQAGSPTPSEAHELSIQGIRPLFPVSIRYNLSNVAGGSGVFVGIAPVF